LHNIILLEVLFAVTLYRDANLKTPRLVSRNSMEFFLRRCPPWAINLVCTMSWRWWCFLFM